MTDLEELLAQAESNLPDALDRLLEFLRIESISTDPAFSNQCTQAAQWLADTLTEIGFDTQVHPTTGHPMVTALATPTDAKIAKQIKTLLFYGHYDVQPVDPLELWHTPPFEPQIQDTDQGRVIRGRGAADDKGQLMTFVEACRVWNQVRGELPTGLKLFFEGEEESGSPSLVPWMLNNKTLLQADLAMVCDTGMWNADTPAISTMLRGMVAEQVTITGPSLDLHSGMYGGPAINPIRVLSRIIAGLHDDHGRITLPGFYEGVPDLPDSIRTQWQNLGHNDQQFLNQVGLSSAAGEQGYSVLEQIWSRPSCDVNGIHGGYTGDGFKTVLPSIASAKISFRLVGDQDPEKIRQSLHDYINSVLPEDCSVEFKSKDGSRASVMPVDAPEFSMAHAALTDEWQQEAVYAGCGGSIPVVGHIKEILGIDSLLIGFGLDDDAIHSPNEKYNVKSFAKGTRSWIRVLHALQ